MHTGGTWCHVDRSVRSHLSLAPSRIWCTPGPQRTDAFFLDRIDSLQVLHLILGNLCPILLGGVLPWCSLLVFLALVRLLSLLGVTMRLRLDERVTL